MKVVIVSTTDIKGGAARAANRLHNGLRSSGIDSVMIVRQKFSDDPNVITIENFLFSFVARYFNGLDYAFTRIYRNKLPLPFSSNILSTKKMVRLINKQGADVVNLQFAGNGLLRIEELPKIRGSLVVTLQDMWFFTGGCHYDNFCGKYEVSCGSCPQLQSSIRYDLSKINWLRKQRIFEKLKEITIVGTSEYMSSFAKLSPLSKGMKLTTIPNGLNLSLFNYTERAMARKMLKLPENKKLILFGAISATKDERKGFLLLKRALKELKTDEVELVVFGAEDFNEDVIESHRTNFMGHINDDLKLAKVYSACDLSVVPSIQEAFGQTATESLACGTPVVAFRANGLMDIIEHKKSGFLAQPFEPKSLAYGMDWIMNNEDIDFFKNSKERVELKFSQEVVTRKYLKEFEQLITGK